MGRVPAVMIRVCVVALLSLSFVACEQVFTTNWFGWARSQPGSMSDEGLDRYARDALRSGNDVRMADAFEELAERYEDEDGDLDEQYWPTLLDLGFAVSGVGAVVLSFPEAGDEGFAALETQILAVDDEVTDRTLACLDEIEPEAAGGDRFLYGALAATFRAVQEAEGWDEVASAPSMGDLDTDVADKLVRALEYADEAERLLLEGGKMNELREEMIEVVRGLDPDE